MSQDTLEKLIREFSMLQPNGAKFIWHGGEPTLAGIPFFEKVVELQRQNWGKNNVVNLIQTNATTINKEWVKFFLKNKFSIGVSIDGCEESHGFFRKTVNGESSFKHTLEGISILRDAGLSLGFIQTVTAKKVENAEKDFSFFYDTLGARSWANNIYSDLNCSNERMRGQSISSQMWFSYLQTIFNEWLKRNDPKLVIREIESLIHGVSGKKPRECRFNGTCGSYMCIESDGSIYPCDRFSGQAEYLWGSLSQSSLESIIGSSARASFIAGVKSSLKNCKGCQWVSVCNNGCSHHRVGGIEGKYHFCATTNAILIETKKILDVYQRGR